MADATQTAPTTAAKKAAPKKRKAPAKRKPAAKRKAPAKRKPVVKVSKVEKATSEITSKAKESGRSALLLGLGCYGMAYDQVNSGFSSLQGRMDESKKKADKLYKELVKRGEKVEKEAKKSLDDIHLPKFELDKIADRKKLEDSLDKAKSRFEDLKGSVSSKFAA